MPSTHDSHRTRRPEARPTGRGPGDTPVGRGPRPAPGLLDFRGFFGVAAVAPRLRTPSPEENEMLAIGNAPAKSSASRSTAQLRQGLAALAPELFGRALRMARTPAAAEDLVQD